MKEIEVPVSEVDYMALWAILDFGLDNLFIDLMRHYKISQARRKIEEAVEEIDELINRLKEMKHGT